MHKIVWYFAIQTDHLSRQEDKKLCSLTKKKNLSCSGFCRLGGPQNENKRKRKDKQIIGTCQKTEKAIEDEGEGDSNCNWRTWNSVLKALIKDWATWKSEYEWRPSRR